MLKESKKLGEIEDETNELIKSQFKKKEAIKNITEEINTGNTIKDEEIFNIKYNKFKKKYIIN